MKKKLLIIALIAIIGFSFVACGNIDGSKDNDYSNTSSDSGHWLIREQTTYAVIDGIADSSYSTIYEWIAYRYTDETNYEEKYITWNNNNSGSTESESYSVYHYTRNGQSSNSTTETISRTKTVNWSEEEYNVSYNASSGNSSTTSSYDLASGFTASSTSVASGGGATVTTTYSIELLSDTGEIKTYKYYPIGSSAYSIYKIKNGRTLETSYYNESNLLYTTIYTQPDNAEIRAKLPNFTLSNTYYSSSYSINSSYQTVEIISTTNNYFKIRVKTFNNDALSSQTDYGYEKIEFNANKYDLSIWLEYIYCEVNSEIKIYKYMGIGNNANIPVQINGKPVTAIESDAFYNCTNLTSVIIPNSVISIGGYAFSYCSNLTSITIPNSVISIEDMAFHLCSNLTSVNIPNSVISIGFNAFSSCHSLTNITIPNSVTSIGNGAFSSCTNLTAINVDAGNTSYSSQEGILYNKNKTTLIQYPGGKAGSSFTIPDNVTSIEGMAFYNCHNLTSVIIPNSVTSIGHGSFVGCDGLTSVIIPNSVTSIGVMAFYNCTNLTSVIIPNSVTGIDGEAFRGCTSLTSVTFEGIINNLSAYTISQFEGDLREKYLAGGIGTYTTTTPVPDEYWHWNPVWTKQP